MAGGAGGFERHPLPLLRPKHTEQLRLRGMDESQIQEAIKVADIVVGFSDYLHKIDYSLDKWMEELNDMMKHIKGRSLPHAKRAAEAKAFLIHSGTRRKCIPERTASDWLRGKPCRGNQTHRNHD